MLQVTGSVSGKTSILVVGKEPGYSKVSKARDNPKIKLMSVMDLIPCLAQGTLTTAAHAEPMVITGVSVGAVILTATGRQKL